MKIAVVSDSGSGLTKKEANKLGIYYLPLQIMVNDAMHLDGIDITVEEIYEALRNGALPTTSMPPMGVMEELLEELKKQGVEEVIAITLSAGLSSTAHILQATAKQCGITLHYIECYSTANIQAYLAKSAQALVEQGIEAEEIIARLHASIAESNTLIIPDDLQHLKRGGRLTPLAAALGGLLKIKPILQLNKGSEGKIDVFDKVRTMSKAKQKAIDTFVEANLDESYEFTVLHAGVREEAQKLLTNMKEAFPMVSDEHYTLGLIGAVLAAHTGLGCLGIQYIKKVKGV